MRKQKTGCENDARFSQNRGNAGSGVQVPEPELGTAKKKKKNTANDKVNISLKLLLTHLLGLNPHFGLECNVHLNFFCNTNRGWSACGFMCLISRRVVSQPRKKSPKIQYARNFWTYIPLSPSPRRRRRGTWFSGTGRPCHTFRKKVRKSVTGFLPRKLCWNLPSSC